MVAALVLAAAAGGSTQADVAGWREQSRAAVEALVHRGPPWTPADDEALADAIGPGDGPAVRHELEPGLTLSRGRPSEGCADP